MAYVHCHSCPWSQDDFWNKSYNPVRFFLKNELFHYLRPRLIEGDPDFVRPSVLTNRLKLTIAQLRSVHSWLVLARSVRKWCRRMWTQVWWTAGSWNRAIARNGGKWPECPNCGANGLDID